MLQYIVSHQALWSPGNCTASSSNVTRFTRLVVPSGQHPLEGLWKGTYGGHGLEIVTLKLQPDGVTFRATKVGVAATAVLPSDCSCLGPELSCLWCALLAACTPGCAECSSSVSVLAGTSQLHGVHAVRCV